MITAGIVLTAVVLLVLIRSSLDQSDAYSSIASALVAIGTAFAGVVLYLSRDQRPQAAEQEADALALELLGQWEPEIKHRRRRFGDQRLIPLSWTGTDIGPVRLRLDGRLDGNPDAAATRLADAFDQLPSRRLVVIGEPGSGKTFLGAMLTIGLLRRRTAGAAVPVFLSLSSWDPVADSLDDWLVRTIATTYYNGRHQAAKALLVSRLLLPILDGLDELPDHARRRAVNRLNDVLDGDRPLVLTCRIAEYEDLIAGGAPTLLRAPVVRVDPVSTTDVVIRLQPWPGIASHVADEPDGPVATALSTPLMLSLFAAAYENREPGELTAFTSRHAVEDHLVDLMVDTIYPDPKHRRWLTYLAEVLHRHDDHDFRWWQLARRTLSPWVAPVLGLLVAAVAYAVVASLRSSSAEITWESDPAHHISTNAPLVAMLFGVVVTSLWLAGGGREPGPVSAGSGGFWRGLLTGAALVLVPGLPILLVGADAFTQDLDSRSTLMTYAGALFALAVLAGAGVGLHELLASRTGGAGKAGPDDFLRHDRRSTLTSAAVTGLVVGALAVAVSTLGAAFGGHLGERVASTEHFPSIINLDLPALQTHVPWKLSWDNATALITTSALFVVLFAMAVLATRAWTRFVVARAALALTGRLPWRLMRFLAQARERGLLRIAGGGYQFWHVRLQERLVMRSERRARRRVPRPVVGGLVAVVLAGAGAVVWAVTPETCQATGWPEVDERMVRVSYRSASGCFAVLTNDDWHHLRHGPEDDRLLTAIGAHHRSADRWSLNQVAVLGALPDIARARWTEMLRGLAAAQEIHHGREGAPLVIEFTHTDSSHESSHDFHVVDRHYVGHTNDHRERGAVVTIDGTSSTRFTEDREAGWSIIGLQDDRLSEPDLSALAAQANGSALAQFVKERVELTNIQLADGVSGEECATVRSKEGNPVHVDLSDVRPTPDLLARLSTCAPESYLGVFVDDQDFREVAAQRARLVRTKPIDVTYLEGDFETIPAACRAKVSSSTAVTTCVATLTAVTRVRLTTEPDHPR
ncbi:NACHT domain-containing protein [Lentzea flava]|nr:NACHT domain-containing protein [Lentzea flava]